MSAPEMNASSPAPRIKSTRRSLSSATCATKPGRACHISILTALRRSGRLKVIQARGGSFCNNKDWLGMGCSSLPKCRDDLVGEQAQVLADVLGPTGERKDDRLGAHIEIFLEPFLTFLRRTGQGVAIGELRKVLGVVLLGPQLGDHFQRLVGPSAALIHWYSTGLELCGKLTSDTDAKVIASARRHVECRPHLGYNHRLVEWQQHHRAEQLDASGRP